MLKPILTQLRTNKLVLFVALPVLMTAAFLVTADVSGANPEGFTLTEVDPTGHGQVGRWQYTTQANTAPGAVNSWRDTPWYWRHWDSDKCDDIRDLYPANPDSVDTAITANGQEVTVSIYQAIDSVWVCFALECDNGTYSFALMRNTRTEDTINSGACGSPGRTDGDPPTQTKRPAPPAEIENTLSLRSDNPPVSDDTTDDDDENSNTDGITPTIMVSRNNNPLDNEPEANDDDPTPTTSQVPTVVLKVSTQQRQADPNDSPPPTGDNPQSRYTPDNWK